METGQKFMVQTNNNLEILTNLRLSIQVSLNGLSFCVLDESTNSITHLEQIGFNKKLTPFELLDSIKNIFKNHKVLKNTFNTVNVIYVNELSALVPKPLFDEDHMADYLKFNSKILKSDFIAFDDIAANDSVNVYVPYVNINNFIYEKFGAFSYKHFSTILIENILKIEKNTAKPKMYISISKVHFEIIVVQKGKLLFYNMFDYSSKEDFIYYILFTIEQLKLNPETIEVFLLGDINQEHELFKIAYKYIRFVDFGNVQSNYSFSGDISNNHSNFVLLNSF
ncbi:MAG TPA: DUF3822 family protein [Flavobacteriaceae bacterium]|nr:DUF3822 family protein [Flavobacteriaceae bacterium]